MKLEICANSFQSALNAEIAGAHRVELCQELSVGGITPSYGLMKKVSKKLNIPIFVLIRPRSGDFVYSDAEFEVMKYNIDICKSLGCHGIVSGVLNPDNTIDVKRTRELVIYSKPLPFTFHRAFDEVTSPKHALEQLIALGVDRILTSGQQTTAEKGVKLLKELNALAQNRISILPGGSITTKNVQLFKSAGFKEIHASASKTLKPSQGMFNATRTVSDINRIKSILNAL
ncbi:copper homeostasis protein CutC [Winogradskyella sp. DF17]|uniref:PF03932 family protein CutC n=2 Tax=Winogradskyella pelagia TaxID=2819984 RepID=A0ABS3SYG0_9FLAO|nr:copper homeostasis protein CutC [Winogradskyella sp. DF17]MBO3115528.1 copper homeostasis protein CutC [Winogradskyella sp. DF17]